MPVLVIADVDGGVLSLEPLARTLGAARKIGPATVLIAGSGVGQAAQAAAMLAGVEKVIVADNPAYAHALAEPMAELIVSLARDFSHILAPSTVSAKNLMPRVALLLDVMVLSDVTAILDPETFERPIYAGSVIQTVRSSDPIKVLTVRTANLDAVGAAPPAPVEPIGFVSANTSSTWIEDKLIVSARPELTSAKIVVSGGRGVGSQESFALIEGLADTLEAAVGASRAAVDAGFASNERQVGQTGKVVAPDLYIAVGISGAIQHLAGMKDSKIIVAINNDDEAPIFQIADYGLVADLFTALPELTGKISA